MIEHMHLAELLNEKSHKFEPQQKQDTLKILNIGTYMSEQTV